MYAIHTTPGFIIESRPKGEAGKLLYIFTRDLGLIMAAAQGIRFEKSKLRYYCQDFMLSEFSFVRGKEFWRLTSAQDTQDRPADVRRVDLRELREIVPRMALLLRRLLHGEEAHPELFDHIQGSLVFIESCEDGAELSDEQVRTLESLIVFRIVHLLGYVGNDKEVDAQILSAPLSLELITTAVGQRVAMNMHINKALKESHL